VRFMFPYSVRWPCRAVRCGRHPDDPAAAFVTVPPRPPPMPAASLVEAAGRFGTRGGTGTRPCGFPPAPAATTAFPLSSRVGHRFERVMHRRSFTAGVPLPARAVAQPGRCAPHCRTGGAPGVFALRGVAPARGCRGVSAARTHLPFSRSLVPTLLKVRWSRRAVRPPSTRRVKAIAVRVSPAAAPGLRPRRRSVPRRTLHVPPRPMPPWTLPLSGVRSSPSCPALRRTRPESGVVPTRHGALAARGPFSIVPTVTWHRAGQLVPFSDTRAKRLARPAFAAGGATRLRFRTVWCCSRRLRRTVLKCYAPDAKGGVHSSSEVLSRHELLRRGR
jgi:hypothetical protein